MLPGITTLYESFRWVTYRACSPHSALQCIAIHRFPCICRQSCEKYHSKPCLGYRPIIDGVAQPYEFITYAEAEAKTACLASAFKQIGLKRSDKVCVLGSNCPEWMLAMQVCFEACPGLRLYDHWALHMGATVERRHAKCAQCPRLAASQACNRMSYVCVPLYETLGENAIEYILEHSEARLAVVAGKRLARVVSALRQIPKKQVLALVYWGEANQQVLQVKLCCPAVAYSAYVYTLACDALAGLFDLVHDTKDAIRSCKSANLALPSISLRLFRPLSSTWTAVCQQCTVPATAILHHGASLSAVHSNCSSRATADRMRTGSGVYQICSIYAQQAGV